MGKKYNEETKNKMVTVLITRTSDDDWYKIKTFPNLKSLFALIEKEGRIVIEHNFFYKMSPSRIKRCLDDIMTLEDAKTISSCKFTLEIYDTYRE